MRRMVRCVPDLAALQPAAARSLAAAPMVHRMVRDDIHKITSCHPQSKGFARRATQQPPCGHKHQPADQSGADDGRCANVSRWLGMVGSVPCFKRRNPVEHKTVQPTLQQRPGRKPRPTPAPPAPRNSLAPPEAPQKSPSRRQQRRTTQNPRGCV